MSSRQQSQTTELAPHRSGSSTHRRRREDFGSPCVARRQDYGSVCLQGKTMGPPLHPLPPCTKVQSVSAVRSLTYTHDGTYSSRTLPQKGKLLLSQIIMLVIDDMKKCKKASATKPPDATREQVHFFFIARLLLMHTPTPLQISNTTAAVVIISWSYQKGKRKPFQCDARCKLTLTYELLMSTLPSSKW